MGFWIITPGDEFRMADPFKQDLDHLPRCPTTLTVFPSSHYVGKEVGLKFQEGEAWKKVFGPVFVYLHSPPRSSSNNHSTMITTLWNNGKEQMLKQVQSWP